MGSATLVRNIGQLRRRLDLGGGDPRHIVTPADLIRESIETGLPRRFQPTAVRQYHYRNVPHLLRGLKTLVAAHIFRIPTINGSLRLKVIRADGVEIDLGLVSL